MRYVHYALLGMGLIIPNVACARPVSYPSGWTAMLMNDGDKNSAHIHYSPTAKTSVGYKFESWRDMRLVLPIRQRLKPVCGLEEYQLGFWCFQSRSI